MLVLTQDNSSKQGGGAAAVTNGSNGAGTSGGGEVTKCMKHDALCELWEEIDFRCTKEISNLQIVMLASRRLICLGKGGTGTSGSTTTETARGSSLSWTPATGSGWS